MAAKKKILAFAREPGGADTIAPVVGRLRRQDKVEVVLLAKEYAVARFAAVGLESQTVEWSAGEGLEKQVAEILVAQRPQVLLTSASSRPQDDMTEKHFWRSGAEQAIPSLAVLDQWQNYILRFSGPGTGQELAYMPTCVAVMDETVRRDMVGESFPNERIFVSGHPRFEVLHEYGKRVDRAAARKKTTALGIDPDAWLVTFVSEPARRFFAAEEGFDEASTLMALLASCARLKERQRLEVALKYHPRNIPEDFANVRGDSDVRIHHIRDQIEPCDLLLASDLVVGMISILLVDSVLLGVPTLSVQLGGFNHGRCIPEKYGAITAIRQVAELDSTVEALLTQQHFRDQYLRRQRKFAVARDGIVRIANKVYEFAGVN